MILDFNVIDTTPGATGCHAFLAPPADYVGSGKEYNRWIMENIDKQVLQSAVRYYCGRGHITPRLAGPYEKGLGLLLNHLRKEWFPDATQKQGTLV